MNFINEKSVPQECSQEKGKKKGKKEGERKPGRKRAGTMENMIVRTEELSGFHYCHPFYELSFKTCPEGRELQSLSHLLKMIS